MTKHFEKFFAASLAAQRVFAFWRSVDLFQALAKRFAAMVLQPGAGSLALHIFSDLVTMLLGCLVAVLENKSDPRGSIHIFDFQIIVAEE